MRPVAVPADALAHAAELERRDAEIAKELDVVRDLEEQVAAIRGRAGSVRESLERLPLEREDLDRRRAEADEAVTAAHADVERTGSRVAALEAGRRKRDNELDRARKEAATARDALADALAVRARVDELESALADEERALLAEGEALAAAAELVATGVRDVGRVTESAGRAPGTSLADLDDWGGRVRAALFVARGTLEAERERVVLEANALGTSVLGEQLGTSSVALVRRRASALLWCVASGATSIYLGLLDVLFDLENGIYGAPDTGAVAVELTINVLTLALGAVVLGWAWRQRRELVRLGDF